MKNEEFYIRVPLRKREQFRSEINTSNFWYRVLASIGLAFVGPFAVRSNALYSEYSLTRMWTLSASVILLLDFTFLWFQWITPYLEKGKGYYLSGKFVVFDKETSMGSRYLMLIPGNAHKIKVKDDFFRSVQKGDKILLERNCLGGIKKIQRISGIRKRLRRNQLSVACNNQP